MKTRMNQFRLPTPRLEAKPKPFAPHPPKPNAPFDPFTEIDTIWLARTGDEPSQWFLQVNFQDGRVWDDDIYQTPELAIHAIRTAARDDFAFLKNRPTPKAIAPQPAPQAIVPRNLPVGPGNKLPPRLSPSGKTVFAPLTNRNRKFPPKTNKPTPPAQPQGPFEEPDQTPGPPEPTRAGSLEELQTIIDDFALTHDNVTPAELAYWTAFFTQMWWDDAQATYERYQDPAQRADLDQDDLLNVLQFLDAGPPPRPIVPAAPSPDIAEDAAAHRDVLHEGGQR